MKTSFPKDKIEIVLLEGVHAAGVSLLNEEGFTVRSEKHALEGRALLDAVSRAHVLGIRSKTQVTAEVLGAADRLLAVGCFCIGTNQVDLGAARRKGIPVFNAPFSNTRSVAELTIAEIIMLHRRTFERSTEMHAGRWLKSAAGATEIRGKTLGIVGYGHIGSQVSVLAEAMGMRVVYFDVASRLPLGNAQPVRSLHELLSASDTVTLHVPATAQTHGMIGDAELRRMRPGSHLINNARGSIVDLDALAGALREGRLGGAALDVFPDEPAGQAAEFDSPLRGLGNVILTPHIGGSTVEAQANIAVEVGTKLVKFVNNGSTAGAVNVPNVELADQGRARMGAGGEALRPHRILHFHKNVPGVMSQVNRAIAELGVNVAGQSLLTDAEVGYAVLDVDPSNAGDLKTRLEGIEETIRARILW